MKVYVENIGNDEKHITLERAYELLAGIPGAYRAATRAAIRDAIKHMRVTAREQGRKEWDIKYSVLKDEDSKSAKTKYRTGINGTEATIDYNGYKIPLYKFNGGAPKHDERKTDKRVWILKKSGVARWVAPSVPAKGHQYKAAPSAFIKDMFTAEMSNGHIGFFIRKESREGKYPIWASRTENHAISEVMGSALSQFYGKEDVAAIIYGEGADYFNQRLEHHANRALSGVKWWK